MDRGNRRSPARGPLALVAATLAAVATPPATAQTLSLPPGFEMVPVAYEAGLPVGLAFATDRAFFVACKSGILSWHDGVAQQIVPVLDLRDEVNLEGDRGLLDVAVHPGFEPDGGPTSWVYLLYTVSPVPGMDVGYDEDGRYSFSRLARWRVTTSGPLVLADLASREVLIGHQLADGSVPDGIASLHSSHSNGTLCFGTDGSLLVSTGDGAHYDLLDTGGFDPEGFDDWTHPVTGLRGPTPKEQDSGAFRAQDLRSLAGKVLRVDPATGDGYPSNPFFDGAASSNASRVFALGMRNPFRMSLRPGTGSTDPADGAPGTLYVGDVGWVEWEEIGVVRGGENLGWPCREGPFPHANYASHDHGSTPWGLPDCQDPPAGTPSDPLIAWNHGSAPALVPLAAHTTWGGAPLGGFTGACAIGGAFYAGGAGYPSEYEGTYFFADFAEGWIRVAEVDAQDRLAAIHDFATGFPAVVDVEAHPATGELWFLRLGEQGETDLFRLRHGVNHSPAAVAAGAPLLGPAPLAVSFDGTGSSDPDDDPLAYAWDFGDGSPGSTLAQPVHVYGADGTYVVRLVVTDPGGLTAFDELEIAVGNTPPEARILTPGQGALFEAPTTIALMGEGSDVQDPTVALTWSVSLLHNFHVHPDVLVASGPAAKLPIDPHGVDLDLVYYRIELTATDSAGLTGTDRVYVYPREHVTDVAGTAVPIARLHELVPPYPQSPGMRDVEVVRDAVAPPAGETDPWLQLDTSHGGDQGSDDWIGYALAAPPPPELRFTRLVFTEGVHRADGGWFQDLWVETRVGGAWTPVGNLRIVPEYPLELAAQPGFDGTGFDTYVLSFDPAPGDAVRLRGVPGGAGGYVSVAELRALTVARLAPPEPFADVTSAAAKIVTRLGELDPPAPTGPGNPDPETIRNGTRPVVGTASRFAQFDTYHDGDQGDLDWIGYAFAEERLFARLVFTEGVHSAEGGRFAELRVEVQHDAGGPWTPVTGLASTPPYPGDPDLAAGYETFVLDFDPTHGRGIRLAGRPDGTVGFVSVAELRVLVPADRDGCPAAGDAATYCATSPHSAGPGATIDWHGCTSVATNDFALELHAGVPGSSGLFYYGSAQAFEPFGDGLRCVGGTTARLVPTFTVDGAGLATHAVDLAAPPVPQAAITPGSTWHFQGWFRDPLPGGQGFNLTDALRVAFAP